MPLVTVIVPVYNVAKYLERCLDSIVGQTFFDYDVILIDDGSTDGGGIICDQYAQRFTNLHVLHQNNRGLSAARNAGIEWAFGHSDSRYLTFVDSDDWIHPDYLKALYHAALGSGCKVAAGRHIKAKDDSWSFDNKEIKYEVVPADQFYINNVVNFIVAWGKLFCRELFSELRFPEGKIHEDEFVIWKILLECEKLAVLDQPIYAYYQRTDSITGSLWEPRHLACLEAMEEQRVWITQHGSYGLNAYIRRRLAIVCAKQIRGMKSVNWDAEEIRLYRKKLVSYIKDAGRALPLGRYHYVYETAWPVLGTTLGLVYRVCRKVKSYCREYSGKLLSYISGTDS